MPTASLSFGDLRIEGASRAGEETWFRVRPPGVVFDVGRGAVQVAGAADLFLTHGHLDHALGLPYVLSLRTVHGSGPTRVHAPAPIVDALDRLIRAAAELEDAEYRYQIHPMEPGARVRVGRDLQVVAFATDHIVPSLGYHLWRSKRKLRLEYRDRSDKELADLKSRGTEIEEEETETWLTYCGDTGPGVFELEPSLFESRVLLLECTFVDEASRDRARQFKHMHLDDLVARAAEFRNRELVLHHTSRRYGRADLEQLIEERLSLENTRVHLFGC